MDDHKNVVEMRDANKRFSASRFGYNGYYKTASVTNSNYASFTFANFENVAAGTNTATGTIDGDMMVSSLNLVNYTTLMPHTGSKCIQVTTTPATFSTATAQSPGGTMEIGLQTGRLYRASVWANTSNLSNAVMLITTVGLVNAPFPYTITTTITATSTNDLVTTIGNWNLIQADFEVPAAYQVAGGTRGTTYTCSITSMKVDLLSNNSTAVYYDDFVLHPVESDFSASIYNARNGRLTSNLDANGFATNYFYDASGKVTEVWKEIPSVGYKRIKRHTYNYARGAAN